MDRLARYEAVLEALRQAAPGATLLVEGKKDVAALVALGIGGNHVTVNQGKPVQLVIDELAQAGRVILLLDWDRTGDTLSRRFQAGLQGRTSVDGTLRRQLAVVSSCQALEHVPADLAAVGQLDIR